MFVARQQGQAGFDSQCSNPNVVDRNLHAALFQVKEDARIKCGGFYGDVKYGLVAQDFRNLRPGGVGVVCLEDTEGEFCHRHERNRKMFVTDYFLNLRIAPAQMNNGAGIGDKINALSVHGTCSKASAMSFSNLSQSAGDISFSAWPLRRAVLERMTNSFACPLTGANSNALSKSFTIVAVSMLQA